MTKPANINALDPKGDTQAIKAVRVRDSELLIKLIIQGADLTISNPQNGESVASLLSSTKTKGKDVQHTADYTDMGQRTSPPYTLSESQTAPSFDPVFRDKVLKIVEEQWEKKFEDARKALLIRNMGGD